MKLLVLALVVAVSGCGMATDPLGSMPPPSEDATAKALMLGSWITSVGTGGCLLGDNFTSGGAYSVNVVCPRADGGFSLQQTNGSYVSDGYTVTLSAGSSSCPNAKKSASASLAVSIDSLTLTTPTGVLIFARNRAAPGTATATFGCFDSTGAFTQQPVAPI